MVAKADFDYDDGADGADVRFSGRLTLARLNDLPARLDALGPIATLDLSGIDRIDTVGAWIVTRTVNAHGAKITGASEEAQRLLEALADDKSEYRVHRDRRPAWVRMLEQVGTASIAVWHELLGIVGFFGAMIIALGTQIRARRRLRWNAIVTRFQTVGVDALPIIGLMTFLIGIVIAQQGAVQLRQFGLEVFTINLVGRASIRELGLLMTAIMVAGRSGSAFAAQIGTMKLTEEIDAMRTIGVSPMEAIVLPRVAAATILMPLLGFYASICAIIGGGVFCWVGLDIPPLTYIQLLRDIIPMTDFWAMLIKAPVFGLLIGVTGCYEGMQVRQNAEEVGQRTTSAVVAAIFLVIVLDAFFAVFFSSIGWN
ncbi:phospholipid/cholesterol/gamma-HCH transport system permease protein [Sphingopyxis panaciterrae]|uniref:ABC transporter permease n=1 Tax=Sphingopyxis panaciterrae TaxID=363841 RepID=UPI001421B9A0|nr:ABC transporter permease [Sphingopyxis panaciterrae]NIJ35621.1 phospholipid/cholesterol/gamma-HCH transport system permease protein [Sphingopyxis panaciterrae]